MADYSPGAEVDPKMAQAYYYRGQARHSKAELDGAIADYNQAVRSIRRTRSPSSTAA